MGYKSGGRGVGEFWASQKFRFPTIIIFVISWTGGKSLLDYLEKNYGNIYYLSTG